MLKQEIAASIVPVLQEYGVMSCYLFGSRATGEQHPGSDVDLAVLFADFPPQGNLLQLEIELQEKLQEVLQPLEVDLVLLQKVPLDLRFTIIRQGQVLYSVNEELRTDFEDVTIRDYLDFKPFLQTYYREMAESILGKAVL